MKVWIKISLLIFLTVHLSIGAFGQCGTATTKGAITPSYSWQNTASTGSSQRPYWSFSAQAGQMYHLTNCNGTSEDTYMYLYNSSWTLQTSNDDDGPFCSGTNSSLEWTCSTTGTYYVLIANYPCDALANNQVLSYGACIPRYSSGCDNGVDVVTRVRIGTLDNTTTWGITCATRFVDYTGSVSAPMLAKGSSYNLQITVGNDGGNYTAAWFDWNGDGDFADAGEYYNGGNPGANGTATINVTVPVGAASGNIRMRIRGGEDSNISSQSHSCGASSSGYGEAEDYFLNICAPAGDQTTYGSGSWIGYAYSWSGSPAFTTYLGYVTESEIFDRDFSTGAITGATSNLCSAPTDYFAVRYKMTKTYAVGYYNITVGGDDGFRLSVDGGSTWLINQWVDQGYTTVSSNCVYFDGTAKNLFLEYYENGSGARASFTIASTTLPAVPGNPTSNSPQCADVGVTLTRSGSPPGGEAWYWQGTNSSGTNTGLGSGTTYNASASGTYYIRAQNTTTGCWSSTLGSLAVTVNALPSTPSNPTAAANPACNSTTLNTMAGTNYWQGTNSSGSNTASPTSSTYPISSSGTYYVRNRDANGCWSSGSGSLAVTIVNAAPSAPTANAASGVTTSQFTANWSAAAGATNYRLDVATDNSFTAMVGGYNNMSVGNVTTYNVTGLGAGTTYYYRVRAENVCGASGNSSTITATTGCNSVTVATENFNSGGLPSGWTRSGSSNCSGGYLTWYNSSENSSSGNTWCGGSCTAGRGGSGYCMMGYSYWTTGVVGYLLSSSYDLSGYSSASLTFYVYNDGGTDAINVYAKQGAGSYSLVGGPYGVYGSWTQITINLNAWTGAGKNQVYIKFEDNADCGGSNYAIDDYQITGIPTATSNPTASATPSTTDCPGVSSTLSVTGGTLGSGASWKWYSTSCGTGLIATGVSTSVSPNTTTTYYVRGEGTCNNTPCTPVTVTVTPRPADPGTTGDDHCGTGVVTLTATGAGAGEDYKWYTDASGGSPFQTGGATYSPSLSSSATYYVEVFNTTSGCTSSGRIAVTGTIDSPVPESAVNAGPDQYICSPTTATMSASDPTTYSGTWAKLSGTATITAPGTSHTNGITGIASGEIILRWTVANGSCTLYDDMIIVKQ